MKVMKMSKALFSNISNFHDYGIYLPNRSITIFGDVDGAMLEQVFNNLHMLDASTGVINIFINTGGGECAAGLGIYDAIKGCRNHVRGMVYDEASSMGSVILQACDERLMAPHSYIMVHDGEHGMASVHPRIKKSWDTYLKKMDSQIQTILLKRIKEKHPRFTMKKLEDLTLFDTILFPKEAIELGLADSVEESFRIR